MQNTKPDVDPAIHAHYKTVNKAHHYFFNTVYHKPGMQDSYHEWMLQETGIDHGADYAHIVDPRQFLLFLLRWG